MAGVDFYAQGFRYCSRCAIWVPKDTAERNYNICPTIGCGRILRTRTKDKRWKTKYLKRQKDRDDSRLKRLDQIDTEIQSLHLLKAGHRRGASPVVKMAYFDAGVPHCHECKEWGDRQKVLRRERREIIESIFRSQKQKAIWLKRRRGRKIIREH